MKYDVISLGELLIDFTENGRSSQGNPIFEANPGGAPGNVLSMLCKLGKSTAFIGKVGNDYLGHYIKKSIKKCGISDEYVMFDKEVHTTLAFVHNLDDGDREFDFFRSPGADMMLKSEDIYEGIFKESSVFHFGSLSMTDEPIRGSTIYAIEKAEENKLTITFDPNLRPMLWGSMEEARNMIIIGLRHCNIVKMSDDELRFVSGYIDINDGVKYLQDKFDIKLILITLGKRGSMAFYKDISVYRKAFINNDTIDTTGAGDTFMGCAIYKVLNQGLDNFTEGTLIDMLDFSNAASSIITTRRGALSVMPTIDEIKEVLKNASIYK